MSEAFRDYYCVLNKLHIVGIERLTIFYVYIDKHTGKIMMGVW